jgi:phosphatidylserine/phosphatidylglycerophosphate/cardiolipin synthase-like enzyme
MDVLCGSIHHKTATLTRATPGGMVPVALIVGSQNWTRRGNDTNDENMVTAYNAAGLAQAAEFNGHFDRRLWPKNAAGEIGKDGAVPPPVKVCLGGGGPTDDPDAEKDED